MEEKILTRKKLLRISKISEKQLLMYAKEHNLQAESSRHARQLAIRKIMEESFRYASAS